MSDGAGTDSRPEGAGGSSEREAAKAGADPPGSGPGGAGPAGSTGVTAADAARTANGRNPEEMTVGELVFEISDRASVLVREEIELAKTEVTEKVNRLIQGGATAVAAGVFLLAALVLLMHGFAWLLNDLLFDDDVWAGFFVEAGLFLLIAAGAGLYAYRSFKRGAPPTPEMAITEAKEIKAAFDNEETS
ncbi:MAG: phage holin family protein [Actinomycetota bacterium]|nr:phage holin family protein [Actinomycetota bacterium]